MAAKNLTHERALYVLTVVVKIQIYASANLEYAESLRGQQQNTFCQLL